MLVASLSFQCLIMKMLSTHRPRLFSYPNKRQCSSTEVCNLPKIVSSTSRCGDLPFWRDHIKVRRSSEDGFHANWLPLHRHWAAQVPALFLVLLAKHHNGSHNDPAISSIFTDSYRICIKANQIRGWSIDFSSKTNGNRRWLRSSRMYFLWRARLSSWEAEYHKPILRYGFRTWSRWNGLIVSLAWNYSELRMIYHEITSITLHHPREFRGRSQR